MLLLCCKDCGFSLVIVLDELSESQLIMLSIKGILSWLFIAFCLFIFSVSGFGQERIQHPPILLYTNLTNFLDGNLKRSPIPCNVDSTLTKLN